LALAIIAFLAIEIAGFQALGLRYLSKFFTLKGFPLGTFVGLLEFVSEIARIISFAFRLFGNLFAGQVLLFVMPFLVPLFLVLPIYGLELFVGMIQGFVFAILTLAFMSQAVESHDH
jgi:F-type H+-transporting ATPase subunit a